ncbi:hypothetical protein BDZ89DRAFT_1056827 [Hymenopellis radicata]|nr:hypothetical protein BDZ89DRAFT_1056827 [Hymenopellis radicata]
MGAEFNFIALLLVPFTSVLVRYRHCSTGEAPPTSLWGVLKRVYQILGIKGLTYGMAPTIWLGIILPLFWWHGMPSKIYISASPGVMGFSLTSSLVYTLVYYIFVLVTVYRAITTTHELDSWKPQEAFHALFTAHERRRPWAIHQIPGLIPALVFNICINIFVLRLVRDTFIFPNTLPRDLDFAEQLVRVIINMLFALLGTVVLAPLEVVTTRLAIQRNYGPRVGQQDTEPSDAAEPPDVEKNADEIQSNVLPLDLIVRYPYLGLVDCLCKIVEEEGWPVLYRGWFFTFLGALAV